MSHRAYNQLDVVAVGRAGIVNVALDCTVSGQVDPIDIARMTSSMSHYSLAVVTD